AGTSAPPQVPVGEPPPWERAAGRPAAGAAPAPEGAEGEDDYEVVDEQDEGRPRRRRRRYLEPHRGSLILTLGIVSLFTVPLILGPIAWIMGSNDLEAMRAGRMDPEGESNTNAGRICGMIATIVGGIATVLVFSACFLFGCCGFVGALSGAAR
ncbi:MAG TPA: hypothetical protein VNK04_01780, partial [Gemmataceae bacterium]|nr:hypothetical protein [Gemmataceae bacterium]